MQAAAATHPVWREALRVGHVHIDAEHEDFARLIEQLRDASDDALLAALDRLVAHAGSHFAAELAAWFPPHVQHLDSALAQWICKHTWDAKPLVLHRRMPVQELVVQA